jgi:hypothetical protein
MTTPHQQNLIKQAKSGALGANMQSVANKRTAPKPVSTVSYDVEAANRASKALGFPSMTEVPTSAIKPINQPNIPEPVSQSVQETFFTGALQNLQNQRQGYEQELATRKADMDTKIAELQTREQEILKQAQPLTEPFREEKEKTERERLQVEENFFANQRLTNELDTLLTQGNALIAQRRGLPMHQRAQALRVNRAVEEVSARTGVIQAVMQARNNQIAQAHTLIDRSVEAIQADRRDSLNYYETLLSLNNQKLLSLDSESKKIANEQLNLIRSDFEKAQENVDHIKNLMQDPQTAQFMADAGVTLMDSPDQVSKKMADQARRQEAQDMRNKLVAQGYEIVPYESADTMPIEVGGQTLYARVREGSDLANARKMDSLDLQIKEAQLNKLTAPEVSGINWSQRANILEMAEKGDQFAIEALGYDPRSTGHTPEEIMKYERNQVEARGTISMIDKMLGNSRGIGAITGQLKNPTLSGFFMGGKSDGSALSLISRIPVIGNIQGVIQSRNDRDQIIADLQNLYNTEGFQEFIGLKQSGLTFGSLDNAERLAIFAAANRLNSALNIEPTTGRITDYQGTADDLRKDLAEVQKGLRAREEEISSNLYLSPEEKKQITTS